MSTTTVSPGVKLTHGINRVTTIHKISLCHVDAHLKKTQVIGLYGEENGPENN